MNQLTLKPKTSAGFIRSLSGVFITKEYPQGLTKLELNLLVAIYDMVSSNQEVTSKVKVSISDLTNNKLQTITNYINKLKLKGVITKENKLHPIFYKDQVIIQNGKSSV